MGHCPYYQAIPEQSTLFRRLRDDHRLAALVDQVFALGGLPFVPDGSDAVRAAVQEALDDLTADRPDLFGSRGDAEATLDLFREELSRAEAESPGLTFRTAFLGKNLHEIEERLVRALEDRGVAEAAARVGSLLRGVEEFAPGLYANGLSLVPASLAREGAALLRDLDLKAIITEDDDAFDWLAEDYPRWRDLYLQAAALVEAILVY
jgi:hypothetical protein